MFQFIYRLKEFMRNFSRKIRFFFFRQKIYLVSESQFKSILVEWSSKGQEIKCQKCGRILAPEDIQGWFYDDHGNIQFFCNYFSCENN